MELAKVLDRIRKLIAHERIARELGSLEEADAFAAKIQQLCTEYRAALRLGA